MKIITRGVIDWETLEVLEEESYEYDGPVALAKDAGSPPQPVDPWQQAAAQYQLGTGTAQFNANLNRTNSVNPLGSTSWTTTGSPALSPPSQAPSLPASIPFPAGAPLGLGTLYLNGVQNQSGGAPFGFGGAGSGTPPNTQVTQLAPQFQSVLQQPIDTSGIAGMPGGPSTLQDLATTRNALFNQQEAYLQPQQQLQQSELDSRLANQGIMPGSAAYKQAQDQLGREQTFANQQAIDSAIAGGGQEQSRLFGLGSQSLQDQLAVRNAPISEFEALQGNSPATASALTPDISGAFSQQYQGRLAGYNANVASDNNTTSTLGSLALAAAMFFSDKRLKEDIKRVGKTDEGLPVYTYRFKGDPRVQMGVMAQDVEKQKPEAVFSLGGRGGPKMVNYGAIK